MNTVLFVNATIGFSENLFLVTSLAYQIFRLQYHVGDGKLNKLFPIIIKCKIPFIVIPPISFIKQI